MCDAKENHGKKWPSEILGATLGIGAAIFFLACFFRVTHDCSSERRATRSICGFKGMAHGAADPPFFLAFLEYFTICFENRLIKCSLTLSSRTLTLLYFVSRIRPQCCMLPVLKSGGGGGGGGGLGLLYLNFLDPPLRSLHKWKEETKLEERGCRVTD